MACRDPPAEALAIVRHGASRVVTVTEDDIAESILIYYTWTHNLAEGAGAAPLAALMKERHRYAGKRVGLILSGGNLDMPVLRRFYAARRRRCDLGRALINPAQGPAALGSRKRPKCCITAQ